MIQDKKNNYTEYTNQELTVERVAVACQPQKYSIREYHTHVLAAFQFIDDRLYLIQGELPPLFASIIAVGPFWVQLNLFQEVAFLIVAHLVGVLGVDAQVRVPFQACTPRLHHAREGCPYPLFSRVGHWLVQIIGGNVYKQEKKDKSQAMVLGANSLHVKL